MATAHWTRLTALVADALALAPQDRAAFLDAHASGTLREEAEALITAHEAAEATDALHSPFALEHTGGDRSPADALRIEGREVGPWRITGRLGEGGMGAVYRARRADGLYDREVALKLLAPGAALAGGAWLARRLEAERRILARLEHPGIARLYDGGVTEDGLPYLAMELVEGAPLTDYAETHALDTDARLALVAQACEAVAYAHRRLVVHRDLKPSNLLVAEDASGEPRVKLLDFGVSALLAEATIEPVPAEAGRHPGLTVAQVMTPAYAAPEQLRREPVTTATDVYALGVLLYELLAGQRPYDLSGLTAAEAERVVCETTPPPPSTHAPSLDPDLDRIVMKALAHEPERRYASAEALADDLRRVREGLPVEARPATAGYVLRRFVRRNRVGVAAALGILLAILGGAGVAVWQAREARVAQSLAEEQAERAEAVAGFLEGILRAPNGAWYVEAENKGPDTPIRAVLDEAAARIDRDFADRPDLRADLHHIIGDTYHEMREMETALYHSRTVLAIRESLYTAPHPKLAEAIFYVGRDVSDPIEMVRLHEEAAEMLRQRPGGNNYPFILRTLGFAHMHAGLHEEAARIFREAHVYARDHFVPGTDGYRYMPGLLAGTSVEVAQAYIAMGDLEEARRWLDMAREEVGNDDLLCSWGTWRLARGEVAEAERLYVRCVEKAARNPALNPEHHRDATTLLWKLYESQGRAEEAAPYRAIAEPWVAHLDSVGPMYRAYFEGRE